MNILDVEFVEELVDACQYFWEAGWGEYHAGNISYLLSDAEVDQLKDYMQVLAGGIGRKVVYCNKIRSVLSHDEEKI